MKLSPQDQALQERLQASRFSGAGFMGSDNRPLEDILASDAATLRHLGVTASGLAERLRAVDARARAALGASVILAPGLTARHFEAMGRIPSPFRGEGVFPKGETRIEWADGRCLRVTPLGIALIERHGFFQGQGSPYRIHPEWAAAIPDGDVGRDRNDRDIGRIA